MINKFFIACWMMVGKQYLLGFANSGQCCVFSMHHFARLFFSYFSPITVCNTAYENVFVHKLYNTVPSMSGISVMSVHCELKGPEHTALGGSSVQH